MATPVLPANPDGSLREFTEEEIAAMRIQRRGVSEEGHVRYNLGPDGAGCTRVFFCDWEQRFSVIWRRVPFEAWGAGKSLTNRVIGNEDTKGILGSVNKTTFLGYWSLTLLLVGVEERLLPDPTGLGYSWDIKYIFQHKPVPFGQLGFYYHAVKAGEGEAGYYMVLRPPAGATTIDANDLEDDDSLFPTREFADLFQVAAI